MKRRRRNGDCYLVYDNIVEIAKRADVVTRRLVRCTCKALHTAISLDPPLDLDSDEFLHACSQAHVLIIREADFFLLTRGDMQRFFFFLGLERKEPIDRLFRNFSKFDPFDQGVYFAGCLQRLGFEAARKTAVYKRLENCVSARTKKVESFGELFSPQPSDLLLKSKYSTLDTFLCWTLEGLLFETTTMTTLIKNIKSFFLHIGVFWHENKDIYSSHLAFRSVLDVFRSDMRGLMIVSDLPQCDLRDNILQILEQECRERNTSIHW